MQRNTGLFLQFMHNKIALPDENTGSLLPTFPKAFKAIREGIEDGGVFLYCQSRQVHPAHNSMLLSLLSLCPSFQTPRLLNLSSMQPLSPSTLHFPNLSIGESFLQRNRALLRWRQGT